MDVEFEIIEVRLNNWLIKRLRFKTPNQVFYESLKRVALQLDSEFINIYSNNPDKSGYDF
jgi:hypothetical protein